MENKPKRTHPTAYMIFSKEKRKEVRSLIRGEGGVPTMWSVSKTTSQLWRDLPNDEKQTFHDRAAQHKREWEDEVDAFFEGKA